MKKNRIIKGNYGYILYSRKKSLIRSIISVALCFAIFLTGLVMYGSNKNYFSIIAALGCLPMGISVVNCIMFYRSGFCSSSSYEKIQKHKGGLFVQYDLEMTSEKENYSVAAVTVIEKNVCCFTEDRKLDIPDCERHILLQISQSGYSHYAVKVYKDIDEFCKRLDQLEKLRAARNVDPFAIEESWVPGTTQTAASVLRSVSL